MIHAQPDNLFLFPPSEAMQISDFCWIASRRDISDVYSLKFRIRYCFHCSKAEIYLRNFDGTGGEGRLNMYFFLIGEGCVHVLVDWNSIVWNDI